MPVGFTSSFSRFQIRCDGALRDIVIESTVWPAEDMCNAGSIEEKLRPGAKSSPAAQRGRKSKFHSAHIHLDNLERSYMPIFMIVQLQTSKIKRRQTYIHTYRHTYIQTDRQTEPKYDIDKRLCLL